MKKIIKPIAFLFITTQSIAQEYGLPKLNEGLSSQKPEFLKLVNTIILFLMVGGIIYIISALLNQNRESPKNAIIGWVVGMIIWGLVNLIFA